ncbi:EGF domain-specific O-linked N-acetylglucosamine transferase [Actinidia chinensis var. chinensis]|uniref:EGF domain-specific O-linked N-acetylglucosamine transferase n=1 Tax=Actinidia chinensis var. chinensis TaxID=1590841 RepID=A0A2R6P3X9_ACTCC|nr:EGF domain-specific O-linked N-acetylglucosamine transferase [Actinidia chinensis var. chinensis]
MPEGSHFPVSRKIKPVPLCWALLIFLYLCVLTSRFSTIDVTNSTRIQEQKHEGQKWESIDPTRPIQCDRTHFDYDICYLNRPTIVDPTTATFFTVDPNNSTPQVMEKIRPYPRNLLHTPFDLVREITLTTAPPNGSCDVTHTSPALVFSAGAWPGNFYHDFNENFIPLFITVDSFFPNRDIIIGIFNCSDGWLDHYNDLLSSYTRHQIINLDEETAIHCFPSMIVGLISHGSSIVDPTLQRGPHPKTLHDFRAFLASTYSRSHASHTAISNETKSNLRSPPPPPAPPTLPWTLKGRPRLVFLNRNGARGILNIDEVRQAAEDVGFDTVVFEPTKETSLHEAFRLLDSSHAMAGVHGAGLTNMLFLRPGSVLIQLAPAECDWLGSLFYGKMAVRLGLEYIVYNIGEEESISGLDKATRERLARGVTPLENWVVNKNQLRIKLDLVRVKRYLKRAYKKAKIFMNKESFKGKYYFNMRQKFRIVGRKFKIGSK